MFVFKVTKYSYHNAHWYNWNKENNSKQTKKGQRDKLMFLSSSIKFLLICPFHYEKWTFLFKVISMILCCGKKDYILFWLRTRLRQVHQAPSKTGVATPCNNTSCSTALLLINGFDCKLSKESVNILEIKKWFKILRHFKFPSLR